MIIYRQKGIQVITPTPCYPHSFLSCLAGSYARGQTSSTVSPNTYSKPYGYVLYPKLRPKP